MLLWGACITILSLLPGKTLPAWTLADWLAVDKLAHIFIYGIWAVLWQMWRRSSGSLRMRDAMGSGLLLMGGYGTLLEVLQEWLHADRYFEVPDIVANIIGILTGFGIYLIMNKTS